MHEMDLLGVHVEMPANAPMIVLRERGGAGKTVPIFIGAPEATAIALALDGVETPRPMTHDLIRDLLEMFAADVERVVITELHDKTFYAELRMVRDGEPLVASCRPSDAVAIAVRVGAPIYVSDQVLNDAGVRDGDNSDDAEPEEVVEEFKEFLDTISPDDFGD
jgi:bifunctional DNase/RNase